MSCLSLIKKYKSVSEEEINWQVLEPNEHADWISIRNDVFSTFTPVEADKKYNALAHSYFVINSRGLETARDAWVYNSDRNSLSDNVRSLILFYNGEVSAKSFRETLPLLSALSYSFFASSIFLSIIYKLTLLRY